MMIPSALARMTAVLIVVPLDRRLLMYSLTCLSPPIMSGLPVCFLKAGLASLPCLPSYVIYSTGTGTDF